MAKITRVAKARKSQYCQACGKTVQPGEAYKHVQVNRFSSKKVRCEACPDWKPSELEGSEYRAAVLAAFEEAHDSLNALDGQAGDLDDIKTVLTDCAGQLRDTEGDMRSKADEMQEFFGGTKSDEMNERADGVEAAADELEGADQEFEDYDGPDAEDDDSEEDEPTDDEVRDALDAPEEPETTSQWADKDDWWQAQLQTGHDTLDSAEGNVE